MSSEIERALARREERRGEELAFELPVEADGLSPLLEMGRALAATLDLRQGVEGVLQVLHRRPAILRCAITLTVPGVIEMESSRGPTNGPVRDDPHFVCTTIVVDDRPIGALAVDLVPRREESREHAERLVGAAAELVAQAVQLRQLLLREPDPDAMPVPPGATLAELVTSYEKGLIERALRATRGNRSRAAKLLRTTERIIGYRVQQYGIDCSVYRG